MSFGKKPAEKLPNLKEQIESLPDGVSPLMTLIGRVTTPHKVVTLPGFDPEDEDAKVALVALKELDTQEARLDAVQWLLEKKKMPEWLIATDMGQGLLDSEIQVQLLWRSMRMPDNLKKSFATSPADVRMNLESDARQALFQEYLEFQNSRSPLRYLRTEAEMEEFISTLLKDSLMGTELSYCSNDMLRSTITELANRYRVLMKQRCSDTLCPKCFSPSSTPAPSDESSRPPLDPDGEPFQEGGEGPLPGE